MPDSAFDGFFVEDGCISTPDGGQLTPDDLTSMVWLRGLYWRGLKDNQSRQEELDDILQMVHRVDLIRRKRHI
ncbi:MAG: hypothetical protein OIF57_11970 [Marinobacterium sp.]|nr:hypothetical protein [Marinobacterium sp.]